MLFRKKADREDSLAAATRILISASRELRIKVERLSPSLLHPRESASAAPASKRKAVFNSTALAPTNERSVIIQGKSRSLTRGENALRVILCLPVLDFFYGEKYYVGGSAVIGTINR